MNRQHFRNPFQFGFRSTHFSRKRPFCLHTDGYQARPLHHFRYIPCIHIARLAQSRCERHRRFQHHCERSAFCFSRYPACRSGMPCFQQRQTFLCVGKGLCQNRRRFGAGILCAQHCLYADGFPYGKHGR